MIKYWWQVNDFSNCVGAENDAKPAMVCTANDLQSWKDFPKGLRVLLLDGDINSASDIRTKLEAMDYIGNTSFFFGLLPSLFLSTCILA